MTRLDWSVPTKRQYETGVDRGVLYAPGHDGVPWSGLTSVKETPSGASPSSFFQDGINYLNVLSNEEFEATIEAYSSPIEFGVCLGSTSPYAGFTAGQQPRKPFSFCYRTKLGNEMMGTEYAYKIHLVYNALAAPSSLTNDSLDSYLNPIKYNWSITTLPVSIAGLKPSAHLIIDSRSTDPTALSSIEDILYGAVSNIPRMITVDEIVTILTV